MDKDFKVTLLGDSISKGVVFDEAKGRYVVLKENYVSLVQNQLQAILTNLSKFGSTITRGISRLETDVLPEKPDVVVVEFGGNDCDFDWEEVARDPQGDHAPKTDYNEFRQTLTSLVVFLKENCITPVLMTLPPIDADKYFRWVSQKSAEMGKNILQWLGSVNKIYWWQERYSSAVAKVAEETGTRLIDIRGAFLENPDYTHFLCADGIHPNPAGHRVIANEVMDYVQTRYEYLVKKS